MGNILEELLPRTVRLVLYVVVFLALLTLAGWQAAEGDLLVFAVSLLGSLSSLLAAGNITPRPDRVG